MLKKGPEKFFNLITCDLPNTMSVKSSLSLVFILKPRYMPVIKRLCLNIKPDERKQKSSVLHLTWISVYSSLTATL